MNNDDKNEMSITKKIMIDYAIEKCNELGININDNNYINNPNFKKLYDQPLFHNDHFISYARWIEQNIVGQKRLEEIYGPYSLKVLRKLTDEERKKTSLFERIVQDEIEKADNNKKENKPISSSKKTIEDIRRYFYRNEPSKFGLIKRLQQFGFDIEALSINSYNQDGYLRLLYFLYNFEKDNNIELTRLLNTPTLENEDSRFNILNTYNGKYIGEIKENISYAIAPDYVTNLNQTYFKIETEFENIMNLFRLDALNLANDKKTEYCSLVKNLIENIQYDIPKIDTSVSLLENFLFKICQYEHRGIEHDIINIYNEFSSHFHEGDNYEVDYSEYTNIYIPRDYLKKIISNDISDNYVLLNYRNHLITLSFGKDHSKVSRNEIKRFNTALNRITNQIALFDNHIKGNNFCEEIPLLLVAACIQDTLREPKCDKMDNKYYRYTTSSQRTFSAETTEKYNIHRKIKYAIINRIQIRQMHMLCQKDHFFNILEVEKKIDMLLMKLYEYENEEQLLYNYNKISFQLATIVLCYKYFDNIADTFKKVVNKYFYGYNVKFDISNTDFLRKCVLVYMIKNDSLLKETVCRAVKKISSSYNIQHFTYSFMLMRYQDMLFNIPYFSEEFFEYGNEQYVNIETEVDIKNKILSFKVHMPFDIRKE